jgi:hypothetical protein
VNIQAESTYSDLMQRVGWKDREEYTEIKINDNISFMKTWRYV